MHFVTNPVGVPWIEEVEEKESRHGGERWWLPFSRFARCYEYVTEMLPDLSPIVDLREKTREGIILRSEPALSRDSFEIAIGLQHCTTIISVKI